ncbi:MAG: hypothetical protein U1E17_07930 [Geminicoccaceae bacterium]
MCGESSRPAPRQAQSSARQAKRQEARSRWAKIAQENADLPEGEVTTVSLNSSRPIACGRISRVPAPIS